MPLHVPLFSLCYITVKIWVTSFHHASGDLLSFVCPDSPRSLPWMELLDKLLAEPRILLWLPVCRQSIQCVGVSWRVWLPLFLPRCYVLWWARPYRRATDSLPYQILVSSTQCHHIFAGLGSKQCNQSGVAYVAFQQADIWINWQEGKHVVIDTSRHTCEITINSGTMADRCLTARVGFLLLLCVLNPQVNFLCYLFFLRKEETKRGEKHE